MFKRQLVLVAMDYATDMERTLDVALSTARAGEADVHADGAILAIAARSDADLVVMGIAHRSWLDRLLFGSTLRRVLRRATVPVLVVPVVAGAHKRPDEPVVEQTSSHVRTQSAVDRVAA